VSRINQTIILCKNLKIEKKCKIEIHTMLLIYSAYTINVKCRVWNKIRSSTFELRQQYVYLVVVARSQFLNKSKNINPSTVKLFIEATFNYGLGRSLRISTVYYGYIALRLTTASVTKPSNGPIYVYLFISSVIEEHMYNKI